MYLSLLSSLLLDELYERFIELPEYILNDDWLAIIVPGFEFLKRKEDALHFRIVLNSMS